MIEKIQEIIDTLSQERPEQYGTLNMKVISNPIKLIYISVKKNSLNVLKEADFVLISSNESPSHILIFSNQNNVFDFKELKPFEMAPWIYMHYLQKSLNFINIEVYRAVQIRKTFISMDGNIFQEYQDTANEYTIHDIKRYENKIAISSVKKNTYKNVPKIPGIKKQYNKRKFKELLQNEKKIIGIFN